jgi:SWIM zinc finger/Transposase, Mutator family
MLIVFPIAFAVVDAENDDNWLWFLRTLHSIFEKYAPRFLEFQATSLTILTLLSDRQKGLIDGVASVFQHSPHGHCLRHLDDNFHNRFPNKELKKLLWQAARATTVTDFNATIEDMRKIKPAAVTYLLESADPKHWAECYFPGNRYGRLTSNQAESLNSWLRDARKQPILPMLETIRHQLMEWFSARRQLELNTTGLLVSNAARTIQATLNFSARRYRVLRNSEMVYEVLSPQTLQEHVVKIDLKTCSCRQWQTTGLPCSHALAVIMTRAEDPQIYAKSFFRLESFRSAYAGTIPHPHDNPTRDGALTLIRKYQEAGLSSDESDSEIELLPPTTRRPPGRPVQKRVRSTRRFDENGVEIPKRLQKCSRCRQSGHTIKKCTEVINGRG